MLAAARYGFPPLELCLVSDFILKKDAHLILGWHGNKWGPQNNLICANNTPRTLCNPHNSICTISCSWAR